MFYNQRQNLPLLGRSISTRMYRQCYEITIELRFSDSWNSAITFVVEFMCSLIENDHLGDHLTLNMASAQSSCFSSTLI